MGIAKLLHKSIFSKILPLGDHVIVCPAHGKGSVCGGEISDRELTTIGYEKKTNPALLKSEDEFIDYKIKEYHYRPPYFKKMEVYNKDGPPILKNIPIAEPASIAKLKTHISNGSQVVDIRSPLSFAGAHIPGSINIWRKGIPMFAGWVLNYEKPIIIVDDFNINLEEVIKFFTRLGYDKVVGYLSEGFSSWTKSASPLKKLTCGRYRI